MLGRLITLWYPKGRRNQHGSNDRFNHLCNGFLMAIMAASFSPIGNCRARAEGPRKCGLRVRPCGETSSM